MDIYINTKKSDNTTKTETNNIETKTTIRKEISLDVSGGVAVMLILAMALLFVILLAILGIFPCCQYKQEQQHQQLEQIENRLDSIEVSISALKVEKDAAILQTTITK